MPAQLVLGASNIQAVVKELRAIDTDLYKALRSELKQELQPVSRKIQANIPSKAPLSGFSRNKATGPERERYTWRKPRAGVNTDLGNPRRAISGLSPLVSLFYKDSGATAGFAILELAGSKNVGRFKNGLSPQGRAMIQNLNARFPMKSSSGRFVLPYARPQQGAMRQAVENILVKYAKRVGRRLK
jgi:hypothetical protein